MTAISPHNITLAFAQIGALFYVLTLEEILEAITKMMTAENSTYFEDCIRIVACWLLGLVML